MDNVTVTDLLGAQKSIVETVPGIGVVLTRERYLDENGWVSLFTSLNEDHSPRGVMVLWQELVEQKLGPRSCTILQRHRFSYEVLYPFDDRRQDGDVSDSVFVQNLQSINHALNTVYTTGRPWDLGLHDQFPLADIQHQFLQGDGARNVTRWGSGPAAVKTHYCSMTLDVLCVVSEHP